MKTTILKVPTISLTILCLASVAPAAKAISPSPDGCYPNYTTAEGCNALQLLGAGVGNTGVGWYSLFSVADANYNTGVGAGALTLTSTGADSNTAVGVAALLLNTSGPENTAVGTDALVFNDYGGMNNAVGAFALYSNVGGLANNAFGVNALLQNRTGVFNTAIGQDALMNNDSTGNGTASYNTAVGSGALSENTDGDSNTAVGSGALSSNNTGPSNAAVGFQALFANVTGLENTAIGDQALFDNTGGNFNVAVGGAALLNNDIGNENTACGTGALLFTTGNNNTAVGFQAGIVATTGDGNVYIGSGVAGVAGESNHTYVRNINATSLSGGGTDTVTVDLTTGLLGHPTSSRRYKENIKSMDNASQTLFSLKPVTFRYKKEIDQSQSLEYGLVAEEVAQVDPNLAIRDKNGQIDSVRYRAINAMLLNEFLKEHKAFLEEQRKVQRLEAVLVAVNRRLKEQEAKIERVSAQIETNRAAPRLVQIR